MNIVLASDDNFVQHCAVTMLSVLRNNRNVQFYLLTEGLSSENATYLSELVSSYEGKLEIINVPSSVVQEFPMPKMASEHISIATYYRLLIPSLLSKQINKVLYLDCDMVILGSLEALWETNISEFALGVVYQSLGWSDYNQSWERLSIPREEGYFNAGMLLMNLDYLREIGFVDTAIRFINERYSRILSHDQDVLNALLYDKVIPLSPKWNYLSIFLNKNILEASFPAKFLSYLNEISAPDFSPIIVHFVSKPKPWDYGCENPYRKYYYEFLQLTKWKGFKPPFRLKLYIRNVVYPRLVRILSKVDCFHIMAKRKKALIKKSIG